MNDTYERDLSASEIDERTALRDQLDDERDDLIGAVEQRRREIRGFNASRKKIESRLLDVRREIRSGKVLESRQETLPFEPTARHGEVPLLDPVELRHLITCVRPRELWPTVEQVEGWHEQVRADVQKWCRAEHARSNPIAGAPAAPASDFTMPNVLENIRLQLEERERKARKRKTAKPGKARAAKSIRKDRGKRSRA